MKRILQIISDSNLGGAGRVLSNYLSAYDAKNYEIHIAVPQGSVLTEVFTPLGAMVHPVQGMADRSYHKEDVKQLRTLIRQVQPHLVHTHGAFSGRVAAKGEGVPVVFSRHSVFPVSWKKRYPPITWLNGFLNCHYADGIIAVSPAAVDNLVETGVPRKKITTIFNGVDALTPTTSEEQSALKKQLSIPENTLVFGILARLEYYKGHMLLLDACEILKNQGISCQVLIAGTGAEEEKIKEKIQEKNLASMVQFLGFWKEVPALLSILDVQLNASFGTEATSIALLEGMSLGIPAIVSDYGGNPAVISHGKNGLVFPSNNAQAMADAMKTLIDPSNQEKQRETMAQGAREIFKEKFTAQVFAQETQEFYEKICQRANTDARGE